MNVQTRARISKAQADTRTLASTITIYTAHMGTLPGSLALLTAVATNPAGQPAGPFLAKVPDPPVGWTTPYAYAADSPSAGQFTISSTGDGTTVSVP